jgi:acyl-CoA dehydrogenase
MFYQPLRFDPKWGGRGLPWTSEVIAEEEIGVLGNTLGCAFVMPSIVGEALHVFGTDAGWEIANKAMQIMGGIGYTDVYPIEKMVRDIRLGQIWTGTNEIMNLLIQHEYYQEVLKGAGEVRNVELDATHYQDEAEKCFTDDDMWRVHQE